MKRKFETVKLKRNFITYDNRLHQEGTELHYDSAFGSEPWVLDDVSHWRFSEDFIDKMSDYFETKVPSKVIEPFLTYDLLIAEENDRLVLKVMNKLNEVINHINKQGSNGK